MTKKEKSRPRGRPPVSADEKKDRNFTFRGRGDMHERLSHAAALNQHSISEEIESRLSKSFENDQNFYGLMRVIAAAIQEAGNSAGYLTTSSREGARDWLHNPWAYDQAMSAAVRVIEAFRPKGDPSPPEGQAQMQNLGRDFASGILHEIARGEARVSINAARTNELRRELGDLAERLVGLETIKEDLKYNLPLDDQQQAIAIVGMTNKKPSGEII
jgi:hypothetical protein